ncbi:MAG: tetratricopeptide repeat protein [Flammeovirgaceae bacterium]|nr:tetratricopeptide repeat protein [Flammeovirgaceae bacterium]
MNRFCIYSLTLLAGLLTACSAEKNTLTSKLYHNTTAHNNGYFYSKDEIKKIEDMISKNHVDDYNRVLRLFAPLDSTLAKSYDKEIQEAVKMASLSIQRHQNSKWVDDAYILVGKARMYSFDWGNAIQTFKYVNNPKITKDKDARHQALICLVRTFTEHQEYNNAQAAIDFLEKEEMDNVNRKNFLLEKAYYFQIRNDYDNMVRSLTAADPLLVKKDRKGRIYFIIGQVYQQLGFEAEAFNYYKKCISTNPEYEVDFYSRLYMAQVTEIERGKDINTARRSFNKLLRDSKNKEFKDKIYYEMGVFEQKQNNLNEAIANYNLAIQEGNNLRIDGEAFLKLGIIYYDQRKYELSKSYYDSAISSLPKEYENYAAIKSRQEVLYEFVENLRTIEWQDSLLALAQLDSIQLKSKVDAFVESQKKPESKQKKRRNRSAINAVSNSLSGVDISQAGTSDWYFGNPSAVSFGQSEFARVWGQRALEDNWRRSARTTAVKQTDAASTTQPVETPVEAVPVVDVTKATYDKLNKEIPRTAEQKDAALKKIEAAYFRLGDIYYFNLQEKENASDAFQTLLRRFPETEFEAESLYKLYLIYKDADPTQSEQYATLLKQKHPQSSFAKILINPQYLQESSLAAEKQKVIYKAAYADFESSAYDLSKQKIQQAQLLGETIFSPSLLLLQVLIIGKTEDISYYQLALDEFIKKYPEGESTEYAKKLLKASKDFELKREKARGIQYILSLEEPHYFVIVSRQSDKQSEKLSAALESFNKSTRPNLKLKTSNLIFDSNLALTFVSEFDGPKSAMEYYRQFIENLTSVNEFRGFKFDTFVITKNNFDIFYRTKGLDEYLKFFDRNYPAKNP